MKYFFFAAMILAAACSPKVNPYGIYRMIDVEDVYKLRGDSVHRKLVEEWFGTPLIRSINERGDQYTYAYFGDTLTIQFNREEFVSRFNFKPEVFTLNFENFDHTRRKFGSSKLRKIEPGKTKLTDVTSLFGSPNKGEEGTHRYRTSYYGRNENLIVYSTRNEGYIISVEKQPVSK